MPAIRPFRSAASTLDERIEAIHAEVEALIQDFVAKEKAQCPGVPEGVIRNLFDNKHGRCACRAYKLALKDSAS